jgi:hypothetical protein
MRKAACLFWFFDIHQVGNIMNTTFGALAAALAAVLLLASGCAQNGPVKPPAEPDVGSPVAGATAPGASPAGIRQASTGPMAGRTRAEVYAEALDAAKHHKSTMQQDREYFKPR